MAIHEEIVEIPVPDYENEIQKPMAGKNHARVQTRLSTYLENHYDEQYDILNELDLELPGRSRPDICIYPNLTYDWWKEVPKVKEAPFVTIEILSAQQPVEDLTDKARDIYFPAGVKSAWFVLPMFTTIFVAVPNTDILTFTKNDILKDPATGIEVDLKQIFR